MNTETPEIRSIEESVSHAHDAAFRAQHLADLILDDLNGVSPATAAARDGSQPSGLVYSADHLAGRLESLCRDLERVRGRLVSNNPKAMGFDQNFTKQVVASGYGDRIG